MASRITAMYDSHVGSIWCMYFLMHQYGACTLDGWGTLYSGVELCVPMCWLQLNLTTKCLKGCEEWQEKWKKKSQAEKNTDKRGTEGEKDGKRRAKGECWSSNSRPWLCAHCWLSSSLFCLFLLYFYPAVWLWSLMNDSICKLHFIWKKSFRMSGPGSSGLTWRKMIWSIKEKKAHFWRKRRGFWKNAF